MEPNFQTSFIPKKSIVEERADIPRSVGFFTVVATIFFLSMVVTLGGLFFYKGVMAKNLLKMESDLNLAKNRFEPEKIVQLQVLDKRLRASTEVLSKHVAISPIFKALQDVTMKTVRYNTFSYDVLEGRVVVKMTGITDGYRSVALQADLFSDRKYFIDPVFSNLSLNEKGNVTFSLEFSVEPSFIDYQQMIGVKDESSTATPPSLETEVVN